MTTTDTPPSTDAPRNATRWLTRLVWFVLLPAGLIVGGALAFNATRTAPTPQTLDAFGTRWRATPPDQRWHQLEWLLNARPEPHAWWPIDQTRLAGMTREEVEALLGPPNHASPFTHPTRGVGTRLLYRIGDIGYLPHIADTRDDELYIVFDADGQVAGVFTST